MVTQLNLDAIGENETLFSVTRLERENIFVTMVGLKVVFTQFDGENFQKMRFFDLKSGLVEGSRNAVVGLGGDFWLFEEDFGFENYGLHYSGNISRSYGNDGELGQNYANFCENYDIMGENNEGNIDEIGGYKVSLLYFDKMGNCLMEAEFSEFQFFEEKSEPNGQKIEKNKIDSINGCNDADENPEMAKIENLLQI